MLSQNSSTAFYISILFRKKSTFQTCESIFSLIYLFFLPIIKIFIHILGVHGNYVYASTFREQLRFDMEGKMSKRSKITVAQLRLFKKLPNFNRLVPKTYRTHISPNSNRHPYRIAAGWRSFAVKHARVSVYHTLFQADGSEKSYLIDSR